MTATQTLKARAADDWHAATTHDFTTALASGALEPEKMAGYLQQDYLFVEGFVRLLAAAVAEAPTLGDAVPGARFLGLICGPENTYFLRALAALDVPQAGSAAPETRAFQELMDASRRSGRYELMLAVLVVAEWTYLDWATPFAPRAEALPFWFGEWITLHSGEGFAGVVAHLRGQLDAAWETLDAPARDEVAEVFTRAVALERAFFDAAWAGFPVTR
ncbi:TenA family protein [Poseidonocella sedimentorum]|uniref:Aminopyrimidine aminohydrolase n=1 Tax=Poseidonocella sedimentorum TaxID=871652 RepID=A0A1I6EPX5_9RHOB|nr:TenA family protein [Poseidonocella sedimentorum]SFR19657.1 thiaminase (transcriptional activator TenA) [Poseidonocella sedimentorum]